ncbi:MAG: NAD-dependent deacetylase [Lachnospiraceae bacterium]|nr:NAD-dependent deacetylase [Lachnospiraceae bacterium]
MAKKEIEKFKSLLEKSHYTVALCGSGMMEEGGALVIRADERAYDIELKYGVSPEYIFSSAYYNTRPEEFFTFYREEILNVRQGQTKSGKALAQLEREGRLHCIITGNIYEISQQCGCSNVINLHGSIYNNWCPHCHTKYSLDYVMEAKGIPRCQKCHAVVRPLVSLFGEMVDSQVMTRATMEIEKAELLILLGTNMNSELFSNYIRYFDGRDIVIVHQREHFLDKKADLVFIDEPQNILSELLA